MFGISKLKRHNIQLNRLVCNFLRIIPNLLFKHSNINATSHCHKRVFPLIKCTQYTTSMQVTKRFDHAHTWL